jgi:hypothetical protein
VIADLRRRLGEVLSGCSRITRKQEVTVCTDRVMFGDDPLGIRRPPDPRIGCSVNLTRQRHRKREQCLGIEGVCGLSAQKLSFPAALAGKPAVCVFGFSKEAGDRTKEWMARLSKEGINAWSVANLEGAPAPVRGMIRSSMRNGTPHCPGCLLRRVAEQPGFPSTSQSDQGSSINPEEIYDARDHADCLISVGLPRCSRPNPNHLHRTAWNVLHYYAERLHAA